MKNEKIKEFILYLIVGGLATLVEWAAFWVLDSLAGIQYLLATALAFALSTFANWGFGRLMVFEKREDMSLWKELSAIYLASVAGLFFNLVIMFCLVQFLAVPEMISKMIATGLVFIYNFLIRKLVIYKKNP